MVTQTYQETTPIFIKDGFVIDPDQKLNKPTNMMISGGKIHWRGSGFPQILPPHYRIISAKGMVVCPGFIDIHCHLREPGFEDKETIATGSKAAAKGGFTTICCMPNTNPPIDRATIVEMIQNKAISKGIIRILPIGCVSQKREGKNITNMDQLAKSGVIAFSDDGNPIVDDNLMRIALQKSASLNLPIVDHCEDPTLANNGVINSGKVADKLGLIGLPPEAEEVIVSRNIKLAEETGGKLHIAHVSTKGSAELIRFAKNKGVHITAEVTPHHLALTEDCVIKCGTNAKVNPPLRTKEDNNALIRGLLDGTIDAIATDHAPHTLADKATDFQTAAFGFSGFETALGVLMGLVHAGKLDITTIIYKLTTGPAKIIGENTHGSGTLKIGTLADVTIFDPNSEWVVDPLKFVSKGRNTPWASHLLRGKVMATIASGNIVYKDTNLNITNNTR